MSAKALIEELVKAARAYEVWPKQEREERLARARKALATALEESARDTERLSNALVWALHVIADDADGVDDSGVPTHACEFHTNPEKGACNFHEGWADAWVAIVGESQPDEAPGLDGDERTLDEAVDQAENLSDRLEDR